MRIELVEPNRVRKSIGAETSFAKDLSDRQHMLEELEQIAQIVQQRLDQHQARGRTLTLKIKFSDYQQITRSKTMLNYTRELDVIFATAKALFEVVELSDRPFTARGFSSKTLSPNRRFGAMRLMPHWAVGRATHRGVRLLGISLSNLDIVQQTQIIQLPLFQSLNFS